MQGKSQIYAKYHKGAGKYKFAILVHEKQVFHDEAVEKSNSGSKLWINTRAISGDLE